MNMKYCCVAFSPLLDLLGAQGILQDALERTEYWRLKDAAGKPPGVMGWWPSRAVTFLDNHDTGAVRHLKPPRAFRLLRVWSAA